MFVLDGSGSVGPDNFKLMTDFVERIMDGFEIGRNRSQFGVVVYSSQTSVSISLGNQLSKQQLLGQVGDLRYPRGATQTGQAIQTMTDQSMLFY